MSAGRIKELQKELFDALIPGLGVHGFAPIPVDQAFHKVVPEGRWIFHVAFVPHDAHFDVTGDVAIRIDAVEDVVNRGNTALLARDRKRTATIGAELGNIADGRQRRWTVRTATDLIDVAASVVREFETFGLPYLERYSNLETMLEAISREDRSSWLHAPIHDARWKRAVALAVVLGQGDVAAKLVDRGGRYLRDRKDPGAKSFEDFAHRILVGGTGA